MKRIITSNTGEGSRDQGIWVRGRGEESGIYAANRVNLALLGSNCSRVQRRERYIRSSFFCSSSRLRITRISFHCLNRKLRV